VQRVEPRAFGFWDASHLQQFDSRWASPQALAGAGSSSWLVAVVYVQALVGYNLQYQRPGREGELELAVRRAGMWVFARGPVPPRPVRELACPWQVVGTW
jgi:hypothetical protein